MVIHCLQHVSFETPATILEWAELNGHEITYTYFFEQGYTLPSITAFDGLLIMGGYMNVDETDKHPWLADEKEFIGRAIAAGKKVIGICLGAQLIASTLGARVYQGKEKEIGFFPVKFSSEALQHPWFSHFPNEYNLFHWHGDTFELPAGALLIASSEACLHQAFSVNDQVLALQFHPEMNEQSIELMLLNDGKELEETGHFIQPVDEIRANYILLDQQKADFFVLLDKCMSWS